MSRESRRHLYKVELLLVKGSPEVIALLSLFNTLLSYFGIDMAIFSYIGGISLVPLIFLYVSSFIFGFCIYHRIFLHYLTVTWGVNIYDCYIGIPVDDLGYLCLQLIVAGVSLFIILYLHVRNNKKPST